MNKDHSVTQLMEIPVRNPDPGPDYESVGGVGFSRSLLDHSADCIKILDLEGRLLLMSRAGQKLMEIDDFARVSGRQWTDFWQGEYLDKARRAVAAARAGGVGRFTGFCLTDRGSERWWNVVVSPVLDESGEACCLLSISRDITAERLNEQRLRESEEKLRVATDAADIGLWFWDLQTDELVWTDKCRQLFGLSGVENLSYAVFLDALHPDDREETDRAVQKARTDGSEYNVEFRIVRPDQSIHWVASRGQVFFGEHGAALRMMGSARDITARKSAQKELDEALERERAARLRAEEAARAKDEFLTTVTHELRSPLNAIIGWVHMLKTQEKPDPQMLARALGVMEKSVRVQQRLIDDLLDTARIITGKLQLNIQPVDIGQVVRSAIEIVRPAARAKEIILHSTILLCDEQISGDADRLQQVVWNLLSNAIKFTPSGGRVEIRMERLASVIRLSVRDTGEGIVPEFLPLVFDRFSQAESKQRSGGLGLGLALVKHLVELHGGTVSAFSRGPGQGATFALELPIRAVRARTAGAGESEQTAGTGELADPVRTSMLEGVRALIVDDQQEAQELLLALLGQYGAEATAVSSGDAAISVLSDVLGTERQPDVLVCDIAMPGEDGYQVLERVRQLEAERNIDTEHRLSAIAVTAHSRTEDRLRALVAGFQMYVTKPVDPVELAVVIASLLGRNAGTLTAPAR